MMKKFSACDYNCPIKYPMVIMYGTREWNQVLFLLKTFFYISGAIRVAKSIEKHRNEENLPAHGHNHPPEQQMI